ncbi:ABC transporter ATP-binding protein [Oscillospiraceae bacterium 50-60]
MSSDVTLKGKKGVLLDKISKIYMDPKTKKEFYAVNNITLDVAPGNFVTLLGPSGCGKTTTLRMIAGFESPDMGEIYIGKDAVNAVTPDKRDTAMMFQNYALFPHLNVYDNISYGLKLRGVKKDEIRKKVFNFLDMVELTGMENRMTNQLSGGQQQRVALARALVVEPSVLLFDEPLSNLDANLRVQMRTEIRRIQQEVGSTAVYVTHDQSEAMSISDQVVVMNHGIIEQAGTPTDIYYHPANSFVAGFIGEANYLNGEIAAVEAGKSTINVKGKSIVSHDSKKNRAVGEKAQLMLRPESVSLRDEGVFPCKVILSCFMGAYQNYHVTVGDTLIKITDYNPRGKKIYPEGSEAWLHFDENDGTVL